MNPARQRQQTTEPDHAQRLRQSALAPVERHSCRCPENAILLQDGTRIDGRIFCENLIEEQLAAPSSARFLGRWSGDWREPVLANNTFPYVITVDAQNAFGAEIRSRFQCTSPQTDGWLRRADVIQAQSPDRREARPVAVYAFHCVYFV